MKGVKEVLVQQPNPQQEIYWVANLGSSNWLRKNWNVSKYPPAINGDCLYFGPGADWNWDNKWECLIPKEWELAALHRLCFWGRRNNQRLRFPLQRGLGRLNMCQISLWFAFYILKKAYFSSVQVHSHWLEMKYCWESPRKGENQKKIPAFQICFRLNPLENSDVCKMLGDSPFSAIINEKFLELMVFQISIFLLDFHPP